VRQGKILDLESEVSNDIYRGNSSEGFLSRAEILEGLPLPSSEAVNALIGRKRR